MDDFWTPREEEPEAVPDHVKHLAVYACGLDAAGRGSVRAAVRPEHLSVFDRCLRIADDHDKDESGRAQRNSDDQAYLRLVGTENALRRRAEEQRERLIAQEDEESAAATFREFVLTSESLDTIEPLPPLVQNLLNRNTLMRIYGPPKSLKSFVMLDMAGCVAAGIPYCGLRTYRCKVLYVVAEGSYGTRARVRAWERRNERRMSVEFYPRPVQIGDPEDLRGLLAYCRFNRVGFIVFDTQARCTVGVNENDNTEFSERIIPMIDILREQTQACVALVHHSGVEGGRARGATAVLGAVDTELEVTRNRQEGWLSVVVKAQKDMFELDDMYFTPRQEADPKGVHPTSISLEYQGMTKPHEAGVEVDSDKGIAEKLRIFIGANPGCTTGDIRAQVTGKNDMINFALRMLIESDEIRTQRNGTMINHYLAETLT